jgi:hypothetical protein
MSNVGPLGRSAPSSPPSPDLPAGKPATDGAATSSPPDAPKPSRDEVRQQLATTPVPPDELARVRKAAAQAWFDAAVKTAGDIEPASIPGLQPNEYAVCPVLGSLVAEGSLKVDDTPGKTYGDIQLKDLYDVMVNRLGISPERALVTVGTGVIGNEGKDLTQVLKGHFNIRDLKGSLLDHQHQGDTGVLATEGTEANSGADNAARFSTFHPAAFVNLLAHSKDGKTLTIADFSDAIYDQLKAADPDAALPKAESEDVFEMAALINTFGTTDAQGVRRIDFQTLFDLYRNQKLPSKDALMSRATTGVTGHVKSMAELQKGIAGDLKTAIKKGVCPFLNKVMGASGGATKAPVAVPEQ